MKHWKKSSAAEGDDCPSGRRFSSYYRYRDVAYTVIVLALVSSLFTISSHGLVVLAPVILASIVIAWLIAYPLRPKAHTQRTTDAQD